MLPNTQVLPRGEPMPEGFKPLVTLEMKDGRETTARAEAQVVFPVALDQVAANIRANMQRSLPTFGVDLPPNNRVMALACYGPSLRTTWEAFREMPPHVDLWSTSGAYNFLTDRGIVPAFHTDVDPREHKAWLLREPFPTTRFYIPSRAHPLFFEKLSGYDVTMYHLDVKEDREVIWSVNPDVGLTPCAITAGLSALRLGIVLGYRQFVIFGMDGSFEEERLDANRVHYEQHASAHPNGGEGFSRVEIEHPGTGEKRQFVTNMLHLLAVDDYFAISQPYPIGTFRFVGDGLLPWIEKCARRG